MFDLFNRKLMQILGTKLHSSSEHAMFESGFAVFSDIKDIFLGCGMLWPIRSQKGGLHWPEQASDADSSLDGELARQGDVRPKRDVIIVIQLITIPPNERFIHGTSYEHGWFGGTPIFKPPCSNPKKDRKRWRKKSINPTTFLSSRSLL